MKHNQGMGNISKSNMIDQWCIILPLIFILLYVSNCFADNRNSDKASGVLNNKQISASDMVIGSRDAKLLIIEYFTPTCTHCSLYHSKIFPELKRKYIDTGKAVYVMRECAYNKQDFDASILARCKGDADLFQKLIIHLLDTQDDWAYSKDYKKHLFKIANQYDISDEQCNLCLNDDFMANTLFDHSKLLMSDDNFVGTPSFYINGELLRSEHSLDGLSKAIDIRLK